MWKGLKRTIANEIKGIIQALYKGLIKPFVEFKEDIFTAVQPEEINDKNYPIENEIFKSISNQAKVFPEKTFVGGNDMKGYVSGSEITLGKGNLNASLERKIWTYAHELGHVKYRKSHSLTHILLPIQLLTSCTTVLYRAGMIVYPFIGNSKALDGANWLMDHTGKYLIPSIILNAGIIRLREYSSDIFAFNQTGILPSQGLENEKRNGLIGNLSKVIAEACSRLESGYPLRIERDIICKFLGKAPETSFVEKIRKQHGISKETNTIT